MAKHGKRAGSPSRQAPPSSNSNSGKANSPKGKPRGPARERPDELTHCKPPSAVFKEVPLALIDMDEQARQRPIDPHAVVERVESIERHGLLQPICVQELPPSDGDQLRYKLVFGAHRLAAMRQLHSDDPAGPIPRTRLSLS
jgi:hypothetical protein